MVVDSRENEPTLTVEFDREEDGRWIAEVPELPGVMVYAATKEEALVKVQALAYRAHLAHPSHHAEYTSVFRDSDEISSVMLS